MKYTCYDWYGNKKADNIDNLKDAVKEALKLDCEVHDKNGDIIYSKWDGWNGDYPNIKKIQFPVADMESVKKAKEFLVKTNMYYEWNKFTCSQFYHWIGKSEWLHSDRWSAAYDWVNDGRFDGIKLPEDIIECLVEEWETCVLPLKVGI